MEKRLGVNLRQHYVNRITTMFNSGMIPRGNSDILHRFLLRKTRPGEEIRTCKNKNCKQCCKVLEMMSHIFSCDSSSIGSNVCLSVILSVCRSLTTSQNSHYRHSFYSILVLQCNVMMYENTLAIIAALQLYSYDAALQITMLVGPSVSQSVGNHKFKQSL